MTPALAALYQRVILDHNARPRGRGPLPDATHEARRDNPLCGDRVTLRLRVDRAEPDGGRIAEARFEADGCALSIASASLLTETCAGRTPDAARALAAELRKLLGPDHARADQALLGDLVALEGTRQFPSRVRCATLAWEALVAALRG